MLQINSLLKTYNLNLKISDLQFGCPGNSISLCIDFVTYFNNTCALVSEPQYPKRNNVITVLVRPNWVPNRSCLQKGIYYVSDIFCKF